MVLRTWKLKIKNGHIAKDIFKSWFNDYKYSYNKAHWLQSTTSCYDKNDKIEYEDKNYHSVYYSDKDLRNLITPIEVNQHIPWILNTPKDIRAEAVFNYMKNLSIAIENKKRKNIKHFKMSYMKKREKQNNYCFSVPGSAIKVSCNLKQDPNKNNGDLKKVYNYKKVTIYGGKYTNGFI
jgi:hypothetical protein